MAEIKEEELTFEPIVDEETRARLAEIKAKYYKKSEPEETKAEEEKKKEWRSPIYKWPDKLAVKKKLSVKQKAFVDHYLKTMNATESYRASKGILDKPELWSKWDSWNGNYLKNTDRVKQYLNEKILSNADELLDIQMDIIRDEKMPPAVRHDAIKDRLNRLWIGKDRDEWTDFTGIWEVTITIKHKQPEIIDGVEILDDNQNDNGEIIEGS